MAQKQEEFRVWLKRMLQKYNMSQKALSEEMCLNRSHISDIIRGKEKATERFKYKVVRFFEERYGETSFKKQFEYINVNTFSKWLDIVLKRHDISDSEIAKEINEKAITIKKLRYGNIFLYRLKRLEILYYLKERYGIDTFKGEQLIDSLIEPEQFEIIDWIRRKMRLNRIKNKDILDCVNLNISSLSRLMNGKATLSPERAENIFSFFEEHGIDTSEGRMKFKKYYQKCKKQ